MKTLKGTSLAGMSTTRERVKNDFYCTPPQATKDILDREILKGNILEPACRNGMISNIIKEYYPNSEIISTDLIDRGFGTGGIDFLTYSYNKKFDNIITNPPYSLGKEFVEKSLDILNNNGKIIMFLKIQFLESSKRRKLFETNPPKYIYVYTNRMATWNNGSSVDEKGKPWATTMCHAWFVWYKGFKGDPSIKWI
jgi:hypothetical protein